MPPREGQEEPLRRLTKVVNGFMSRPDAAPFLEPVDWRGLELFDYPEVVTQMMDLGTIQRKLERQQYNTAWECAQDIKLVWSNCQLYNTEGSELWMIAKSFNRKFEDKFRKIKQEFDVGEDWHDDDEEEEDDEEEDEDKDEEEEEEEEEHSESGDVSGTESKASGGRASSGGPSLDARAQLAANLILLQAQELGHVMNILERECPQALETLPDAEHENHSHHHNHKGHSHIPQKMEIVVDQLDGSVFTKISQYAAEKAIGRSRGIEEVTLQDISGKRKRRRQ
mmetsp:Transcript_15038/g.41591  ORF Transcript_15038/g.41591 Transcript_15038/m.41591 type:complete len:282 (-) Transcript_15038:318-1163(-)